MLMTLMLLIGVGSVNALPAHAVGSYNNANIAELALDRLGQYGGQCKTFVNNIVSAASGGSQWPAPGYHSGFQNAGGVQVSTANATKGDIIQVGNSDDDWPLHTAIVVENRGGGDFWVVDSNWGNNERVSQHAFNISWGNGSDTRIWRMGTVPPIPPVTWNGVGNALFRGSDTLSAGQQMNGGQYLASTNGIFALVMQSDGNLVLYGEGHAVWQSKTSGHPGAILRAQTDGNIVLYAANGTTPLWNTETNNANRLVIQPDGNLVARTASNAAAWASGTDISPTYVSRNSTVLTVGEQMNGNQYLRSSDKRYFLLLQPDGNLVLYGPGYHVLWHTHTGGRYPRSILRAQTDGNIVLYDENGTLPLWNTETTTAVTLGVQPDGNLVARDANNQALWSSGTAGKI
jgi:hypothetical protein